MMFQAAKGCTYKVLNTQHTHPYFSITLPQVASSCPLSPVFSIKIFNSLRRSHLPFWSSFFSTDVTAMKNKHYMQWNLSEKSLLLVIWYYAIISIQTSHYWDSRTFDLRYNNSQREYLFQEFQRAHVLTHSRLIITLDSLQVSMRSLASKIRSLQNLNKWKHTDLWAIILVMLLHTDPAKQTEVQFPYVLFKAQLCHSPVQIRETARRWSCCSAYLVRNIFFCVLCPIFLHGKIISVLGLVL